MINNIQIKNFKSIKNIKLQLSELNIFCGENASGKTSIIHALLLAAQKPTCDYSADGSILKIGELNELKNTNGTGDIQIKISCNNSVKEVVFMRNEDISQNKSSRLIVEPDPSDILPFEKKLFYLSSNRMGVMDTYSKGNYLFGTNGEAVVDFFFKHQEDFLCQEYMQKFKKTYPKSNIIENAKFIEHIRFWMEYITGENIAIDSVPYTNQYTLRFGMNIRPINTGSGYSFLLPIIVVCLGAILIGDEQPTVVLENPEIYLHPEAQKRLSDFFVFCKSFIQLIVETHSEHLLKNILDKKLKKTKVFVVKKINNDTKYYPFTHKNFKTHPISYPEVIYTAFGIVSPELHIQLYGMLHSNFTNQNPANLSLKCFDGYLTGIPGVPCKTWTNTNNNTHYNTLPTFIRNKIDHPEARDANNKKYSYTETELKTSIDWMLSQL